MALLTSLFVKGILANLWLRQPAPPDHSVISGTAAIVCLLGAILPWASRNGRFAIALLINLGLTTLLTIDRVHMDFFGGDPASVIELSDAWQILSVTASVRAALHGLDAVYYADVLVALVALPFYRRMSRRLPEVGVALRGAWSGGLLVVGLLAAIPTIGVVRRDPDNIFGWRSSRREYVRVIGFLPYHVYDVILHVGTVWDRVGVGDAQRRRVQRFIDERRQALRRPSPLFGVGRGSNLLIVQSESLQSFPVGLKIAGQSVTPHLDEFAKESLRFVNFYDQTHDGATSDSVLSALQSLHPLAAGAVTTHYPANQYRGLPALLSAEGYTTLAAMGAPGQYWNIGRTLTSLGFGRLYLGDFYKTGERFGQGLADGDFFRQTVQVLMDQPEPFMAFLITVSNHHPYDLPPGHQTLQLGALQGTLVGKYLDSVHYIDAAFGDFCKRLRETGLMDRSVVVLFGDHQGWLQDPPEAVRLVGLSEDSALDFWKVRRTLPFLIRLPRGSHAGTRTTVGGHLDISPTLLGLLGVISPDVVMMGTDLTHGIDSLVVFSDGSFADGKHFRIGAPEVANHPLCYEASTSKEVSCLLLEGRSREARERLEISDTIVFGNLVRELAITRRD